MAFKQKRRLEGPSNGLEGPHFLYNAFDTDCNQCPAKWMKISPKSGLKRKHSCIQKTRSSILETRFDLKQELGKGNFGKVRVCKKKKGGAFHLYACKSILKEKGDGRVQEEIEIMQHLAGHSGVVNLREVFEDKETHHLVMEMCEEGSLLDAMKRKGRSDCSEKEAARLMKDLVVILKYIHEMGVVHRDIKPENILFTKNRQMKLADFGLAARFDDGREVSGKVGTPYYMAPEVVKKLVKQGKGGKSEEETPLYNHKADIWSSGILLHLLLIGKLPFQGNSAEATIEATRTAAELDFNTEEWSRVSFGARDLLSRMLKRDAFARISVDDILAHPWIILNTSHAEPNSYAVPVMRNESEIKMDALDQAFNWLNIPNTQFHGPYLPVQDIYLYNMGNTMQAAY